MLDGLVGLREAQRIYILCLIFELAYLLILVLFEPTLFTALNGAACTIAGLSLVDADGNPFLNSDGLSIVGDNDGDSCWDFVNGGMLFLFVS